METDKSIKLVELSNPVKFEISHEFKDLMLKTLRNTEDLLECITRSDESIMEDRKLINEEIAILECKLKIFMKTLETFRDSIGDSSVAKEYREKTHLLNNAYIPMYKIFFESSLRLLAKLK